MGLIGTILGAGGAVRQAGEAVGGVAEVLVGNAAEREAAASREKLAAVGEFGAEFALPASGRFDGFVNGLNRLPRPLLALSTVGLFAYAMAAPSGFSLRMQGLALVPEPLWWLLGAIVSFYFGARELHHQRMRGQVAVGVAKRAASVIRPRAAATGVGIEAEPAPAGLPLASLAAPLAQAAGSSDRNAAVEEWRRLAG